MREGSLAYFENIREITSDSSVRVQVITTVFIGVHVTFTVLHWIYHMYGILTLSGA